METNNINQEKEEEEVRLWVPDPDNRFVVEENKEDYYESSKNILPRVCRFCSKSFGSGKALGGHMRIHFPNKRTTTTFKASHNDHHRVLLLEEEPIICKLCRKGFRSMKSLYGHMRCHPGRDWKGIKPPPTALERSTLNETDGGGRGAVDLKDCLTSWQMTARRGRKPRLEFSVDDKHDHEAVTYLMMLAHGKYRGEIGSGCISNPILAPVDEDQELDKGRSNLEFDLNELPTSEGEAGSSMKRCVSKP